MRHIVPLLLACALGASAAWAQEKAPPPPSSNADYPVDAPAAADAAGKTVGGELPPPPASLPTAQALADYLKAIHAAAAFNLQAAAADPAALAALQQTDAAERITAAQALLPRFPGAQRVRVIPAGSSDTDNEHDPPCSFACLDLAGLALKTDAVLGEAHLFGAARSNLAYAIRLGDAAQPAGTLLVQYPGTLLENAFAALRLSGSYVELRQATGGRSITLTQTGDKALKQGAPTNTLAAGGALRLALWLPGGAKEEVVEPDFPWVTLGISGFVALLALAVLALRLRKAARQRAQSRKKASGPVYNPEAIGGADAGAEDATIIFAGGAADVDVESILEKTGFRLDGSANSAAPVRAPKAAPAPLEPGPEVEHTPKDPMPAQDDATPMMPLPALDDGTTDPKAQNKDNDNVIEFKL